MFGSGTATVFPLCLSQALTALPPRQNEVSGLLMMGRIGGAIFPPIMGAAADAMGQAGSIIVVAVGAIYVLAIALAYDKAMEPAKK